MPTLRSRRRRVRETRPSPYSPSWEPRAAQYGTGIHHNLAVPMSDGVELRVDIHYPTEPGTDRPAAGPFPVLMSMTPYGKKAPPPAAQIGGGPTPYLIKRGYIEVMVDVRGSGVSGGSFEMFGARQAQDGVELVDWASKLPNANGRVGMFGVSYLAINQLFTAAAVGPDSPLKAIFPVMAARDFYRDAAAMGGAPHLRTVRAYGGVYRLLNLVNPALEAFNRGKHPRPRAGGIAGVRERGRAQRGYFRPLIADAVAGGETAFDEQFWDALRPAMVLPDIVANKVAVFLVGGWHDAFQRGAPLNYAALQNAYAGRPDEQPMQPGQPVSEQLRLMMGPWYHVSDYGGLHLHALQLRWFDYWLNDDAAAAMSGSPFTFQAIGSPRWFHAREYPLPAATPTRFYLSEAGRLTADCAPETSTATVKYVGRGPVSGRSVEQWTLGMTSFIRTQRGGNTRYDQDNRRVQRGALTYTTEAFAIADVDRRTDHADRACDRGHHRIAVGRPYRRRCTRRRMPTAHPGRASGLASRAGPGPHLVSVRRHRAQATSHQHSISRQTGGARRIDPLRHRGLPDGRAAGVGSPAATHRDHVRLPAPRPDRARPSRAGRRHLSAAPRWAHSVASADPGSRPGQLRLTQCGSVIRAARTDCGAYSP